MNGNQKRLTKLSYGMGNLGYSVVSQTINNFLMFFGTSVAGISGALVGLAIAIGTFWDAVTDPIVGGISDNANTGIFGKRQTYVFVAGLIMAITSLLIWNCPTGLSDFGKFVWFLISLLIFETADTFFATPYSALGFEMATSSQENTSIQSIKSVFYLIGMMLPSLLLIVVSKMSGVEQAQTQRSTYITLGYITSIICIISTIIFAVGTKNKNKYGENMQKTAKKISFFAIFSEFFRYFKNKNYVFLIVGYSISMIASCFLTSIGMHVFTYSFHFSTTQISVLLTAFILGAIFSQFFIIKKANKSGKISALNHYLKTIILSIGILAIIFILRSFFNQNLLFYIVLLLILLCGYGAGSLYNLPFSIFSDLISLENEKNSSNSTALQSGIMTFVNKCTNAFSLLVVGILLDVIKFNSSEPVQALQVQNKLGIILIASVSLSISIALAMFSKIKQKNLQ